MSVMLRTEIARLRSLLAEAREAFIYDRPHWSPSGGHNLNPTGGYDSPWPKDCVVCVMLAKLDAELGMAAGENDAASGPGSGVTPDHVPASITQAATPAAPDHAEPVTGDEPPFDGHHGLAAAIASARLLKAGVEVGSDDHVVYLAQLISNYERRGATTEADLLRLAEIAARAGASDAKSRRGQSATYVAEAALHEWRKKREKP